jgi:3-dehydroquinate synthase
MGIACKLSWSITGFNETIRVGDLLKKYGLPPDFHFDNEQTFRILSSDKKKENNVINFVLLNKIGKAVVKPLPMQQLKSFIDTL